MERRTLFVDLILPLALPNKYTYRVPFEWNEAVLVGQRVIVQFGRGNKQYAAIIAAIHENAPKQYQAKYIDAILDERPIVYPEQLSFWEWLSKYYMAHIGEVMITALPGGLQLSSETKVVLHPDYQAVVNELSDDEFLLIEALEMQQVLNLQEIAKILNVKHVQAKVKALIEKKAIIAEEEMRHRYKPKTAEYIRLNEALDNDNSLSEIFNQLERSPRQLEVLMAFIDLTRIQAEKQEAIPKSTLQKRCNASSSLVNELVKKGVFEQFRVEVDRIKASKANKEASRLNPYQLEAKQAIDQLFKEKDCVLLQGVTSSGKTEIYIHLIKEAIEKGQQVLYLLPEIALTTQIVMRLQAIFGNKVGVFHSRFNQNERVEVWNKVLAFEAGKMEQFQIILGARSSLFLPFSKLGLIIIDEEHETTFKQQDPSPRYHARDAAIYYAHQCGAKVLLGSATPSIESRFNANEGKYGFVKLDKRFGDMQMPEIICADVKEASKRKKMHSHFTPELLQEMKDSLEEEKQIILFQNRRGYSPIMLCETCGNAPQCVNCDVSLTYHKYKQQLICHYCSYTIASPSNCPSCGDTNLQVKGFGTEKIEEELSQFLPEAKIGRMDLDTTRAKKAYQQIISAFEEQELDILVGTQMVSKGLDFEHVGLVGILNADNMLHFPDFRAFERSYQLMAQVAGRAGRKGKRGKVIIQTFNPYHPIIRQVMDHQYEEMYGQELMERKKFNYPPFYRLIQITLKHRKEEEVKRAAYYLGQRLKAHFSERVLGPEAPGIARIRNFYHQQILLKFEKQASIDKAKQRIRAEVDLLAVHEEFKGVRLVLDIDPI